MTSNLTKEDFDLINTVFSSATQLEIDEKHINDGDFTQEQFQNVWSKVIDHGNGLGYINNLRESLND